MTDPTSRRTLKVVPGLVALLGLVAVLILCVCVIAAAAYLVIANRATGPLEPNVEYVLDVSARMASAAPGGEGSRLEVARSTLAEVVRDGDPQTAAGLRLFGSGRAADPCQDTELRVPIAPGAQPAVAGELGGLAVGPAEDAALAQAMIAAIGDLVARDGSRTIVLVTGGPDLCAPEVAAQINQALADAGVEVQSFVVGYGLTPEEEQAVLSLVESLEGALYVSAPDGTALLSVLQAIQEAVDSSGNLALPVVVAATPGGEAGPTLAPSPTPVAAAADATPTPGNGNGQQPATAAPTNTPPAATPGGAGNQVGQTACDHPYFPLRTGATWDYTSPESDMAWTVNEVIGDQRSAEAEMTAVIGDVTLTYNWICSGEGLVSYNFGALGFTGTPGQSEIEYEVLEGSGVFLPPAAELAPGATWQNSYTIRTTVTVVGQAFVSTVTMAQSYEVAAVETVTTPAGTFEALRIEGNGTISTEAGGQTFSSTTSSVQWFSRDVGLVRSEYAGETGPSAVELVSYDVPR